MMQAATDGVNFISLSLGGVDPFQTDSPYTSLVHYFVSQGIAVIAANGNDGDLGIYWESSPVSVESILAAGFATNVHFPAVYNMEDSGVTLISIK